jgi:hypothetical protein
MGFGQKILAREKDRFLTFGTVETPRIAEAVDLDGIYMYEYRLFNSRLHEERESEIDLGRETPSSRAFFFVLLDRLHTLVAPVRTMMVRMPLARIAGKLSLVFAALRRALTRPDHPRLRSSRSYR